MDLELNSLIATSDGEIVEMPRFARKARKARRRRQRALARCTRGPKRRLKARTRLAARSAKIARQRRDHPHELPRSLVSRYRGIAFEDLNMSRLKKGMLAQSVHDSALTEAWRRHLLARRDDDEPLSPARIEQMKRKAQTVVARRKRGSKRRLRAQRRAARLQVRQVRIRRDVRHRAELGITRRFGVAVLEDLNTRGMTTSARGAVAEPARNARQKGDAQSGDPEGGLALVRNDTNPQMEERDGRVVTVQARFTSQTCSVRGVVDAAAAKAKSASPASAVVTSITPAPARRSILNGREHTVAAHGEFASALPDSELDEVS